jgi:ubiquinone/menaquinone biosynthesis C-methylase UbiE
LSSQDSRPGAVNSLRDRRVARVIDREIAPIWHDRFARLIIRNLPNSSDVIALDIHCGVGRTTAELLHRLGATARVLAIEPDDTLIELARTRMRPEWKNRVYLKVGNFDDITAMADDSYNLVVANLVLGDAGDLGSALTEMIRVNRIGGRILATVPIAGSWNEVEDIFAEVLRDAGLHDAVRRLDRLRELRPTGPKLASIVRKLGVAEDDFVIEQERFQMLFPSGREFLFAPVVEHGPLRLWKAVIGKDGSPQELFWRLKEAIDTYYTGHVLAVNVLAGLININVAKGTESPGPRLAARFWRHYPGLDALWGGLAAGYVRVSEPSLPPFGDVEFDFDLEIDEGEAARRTGAQKAITNAQKPVTTALPIAMDDLADEDDSPSDAPYQPPTPARKEPVSRAGRIGAKPFQPVQPLSKPSQPSQPAKPVIAEDDFSDINEPVRPTYRPTDLRSAFGPQPDEEPAAPVDEPEAREELADRDEPLAAPADLDEQAEHAEHAGYTAPTDDDEVDEPADPTAPFRLNELREAVTHSDEPVDDTRHAAESDGADSEQDEPDESNAVAEQDEPDSASQPEADEDETSSQSAAAADDAAEQAEAAQPVAEAESAEQAVTPAESGLPSRSLGRSSLSPLRPTPDSGAFRRPLPEFRPPPDSGSFLRPTAASPNTATRPDSGVFRPPAASPAPGLFQPPTSSLFQPPATDAAAVARAAEASEARGPTPDPVGTGSFKVFAPPRPRLSSETAEAAPSEAVTSETAPSEALSPPESAQPETLLQPAQPVVDTPRRSLSDRLGSLLLDLDPPSNRDEADAGDDSEGSEDTLEADEEIEAMEELDEAEEPEQARPATPKPPPPPRPPPPPSGLLFKPRPLLPIVPPKPKK